MFVLTANLPPVHHRRHTFRINQHNTLLKEIVA